MYSWKEFMLGVMVLASIYFAVSGLNGKSIISLLFAIWLILIFSIFLLQLKWEIEDKRKEL